MTPVARLTPVELNGVIVSNATLHNEDEIKRKDVRVGDDVIIQRAGEVIPEVVGAARRDAMHGVSTRHPEFIFPHTCPVCGTAAVKDTEDEAVWRCPNEACPARIKGTLKHFVSKNAADSLAQLGNFLLNRHTLIIPFETYSVNALDALSTP
ncbi:hypothetical protein HP1_117 [Candidatus Termititenax spirochaetophilus]|uniref:DNA ligase (NAD(+)) n=1 Tax=Candidatus Termititenax spirochaetophilus TaxID=2218522 RepID=A0A388T8D3_9BACT|nr:hypothetical protein HP1_117 [Candidatus Termititenax spirochaetophilus]